MLYSFTAVSYLIFSQFKICRINWFFFSFFEQEWLKLKLCRLILSSESLTQIKPKVFVVEQNISLLLVTLAWIKLISLQKFCIVQFQKLGEFQWLSGPVETVKISGVETIWTTFFAWKFFVFNYTIFVKFGTTESDRTALWIAFAILGFNIDEIRGFWAV